MNVATKAFGDVVIDASRVGVTFKVDAGSIEAVRDVSFQLRKGQTLRIPGSVSAARGKRSAQRSRVGRFSTKKAISPRNSSRTRGRAIRRPTSHRR